MKDNDLSAEPTRRYWVTADVVFSVAETSTEEKVGWFRWLKTDRVSYAPNLAVLSMLWQWSSRLGVRMELVFIGNFAEDSLNLWQMLEISANPFSDYFAFDTVTGVHSMLPYRPDLMGIIDAPDRSATWGSRGLTIESLR